jgi:6-phosphogluconolactonase/glucosamine-6-phosphate isomerase/deaminase
MGFEETNKTSNARNTKNLFFENSEIIKSNKTIPNGETKKGKILCKYINISITYSN